MIRNWLINALAVIILAYVLPGIWVANIYTALAVALVLGILNAVVKPLLVVLTIPITVVTLGLFLLIINVLMIELTDYFITGFRVDGFWWALIFSFGLSLVSGLIGAIIGDKK